MNDKKFMPSVLRPLDLNVIYTLMINRRTFQYTFKNVVDYFCRCVCLRRTQSLVSHGSDLKRHYYHRRGKQKLAKDLDIVRLLKRI